MSHRAHENAQRIADALAAIPEVTEGDVWEDVWAYQWVRVERFVHYDGFDMPQVRVTLPSGKTDEIGVCAFRFGKLVKRGAGGVCLP